MIGRKLDYYLGRPMATRLKAARRLFPATLGYREWIKPQIAEIFCGGDQVVLFTLGA